MALIGCSRLSHFLIDRIQIQLVICHFGSASLETLNLRSNSITGTIPTEIGMLSLDWLLLINNLIAGTFPTELCAMINTIIYYDEDEISCSCIDSIYIGTTCT